MKLKSFLIPFFWITVGVMSCTSQEPDTLKCLNCNDTNNSFTQMCEGDTIKGGVITSGVVESKYKAELKNPNSECWIIEK